MKSVRKKRVHTLRIRVEFDKPCSPAYAKLEMEGFLKEGEYYPDFGVRSNSQSLEDPEKATILSVTG